MTSAPLRVLLLENIHPRAKDRLEREGYKVRLESDSPGEADLTKLLKECDAVGIRSKTQVRAASLEANPHLLVVGAFCIGVDQVELACANRLGIPVFNAPYSNTRSVAELVMAEFIALARRLGDRSMQAHQGQWTKSAEGSHEIRGKTLGIVGYGHIGSQVSVLAEAFGMRVIFFDTNKKLPLGNSQPRESLREVLADADFVTLHVPDTAETRGMIGARELADMKPGAHLVNASRGGVVDIPALASALRSGKLGGAAIDVFPKEPASNKEKFTSELQGCPNVLLTPHIGGSTEEAQEAIGAEVAETFVRFLKSGSTRGAVNFPNVDLPVLAASAHRLLNVHRNVPGVLSGINGVVSEMGANIAGQFLATDTNIGYLVMDMEKGSSEEAARRISALSTSIKTRILF